MNTHRSCWKRWLFRLGLFGVAATSAPAHALVFQWQENMWPEAGMRLSRVAASAERLIAIGSTGAIGSLVTSPDLEPIAATSSDGLDWQIVDLGLAGRFVTDIIHTDDGFIVALEGGRLRIGDFGGGWTEVAPPDEFRLQSPALVEHQSRLLLFGRLAGNLRTARVIATADFQTWDILWEESGINSGPVLSEPASSGSALAMRFFPEPPAIPVNNLLFTTDGSDWEAFDDAGAFFDVTAVTASGPILFASIRNPSQPGLFTTRSSRGGSRSREYGVFATECTGSVLACTLRMYDRVKRRRRGSWGCRSRSGGE